MTSNKDALDPLGLKLDDSDVLTHPPAVILYGPSGAGKSTEMARAFPNCLYVQTAPTVLRPYASFLEQVQAKDPELVARERLKMPNKITIPKTRPRSNETLDPRPILQKIFDKFIDASAKGTNPYDGIVIDEWTEMSFRIHNAIMHDPSFGKNMFKRIDAIKDLHYQLAEIPRATGTVLGLVCHEMPPAYDFEEGSPTYGALQHRGGPKFPIKTLTGEVSGAMDIVLRIQVESAPMPGSPSQRYYCTELQKEWISKIRTWGLEAREPLGLRDLLTRAGYKL